MKERRPDTIERDLMFNAVARAEKLVSEFGEMRTIYHFDSHDRLIGTEEGPATDYLANSINVNFRRRWHRVPMFVRLENRTGNVLAALPPDQNEAHLTPKGIVIAYDQARGDIIPYNGLLYYFDDLGNLRDRHNNITTSRGQHTFANLVERMGRRYQGSPQSR